MVTRVGWRRAFNAAITQKTCQRASAQVDARLNIVQVCIDVFSCNAFFKALRRFSSTRTMEEFNTEFFIDEIEKRPSIWDMTSRDYSNKIIKRNAWEEIVLIFSEEGCTEEKKKVLGMYLLYFNYLFFITLLL